MPNIHRPRRGSPAARHDLRQLKAVVAVGGLRAFTFTAERGAEALEISDDEAIGVGRCKRPISTRA